MKLIKLSQGFFTQVDDDMFEYLNQWKWCAVKDTRTYYAVRHSKKENKTIIMHRLIMNTPKGLFVDHADHDGLNNQRYNLRNGTMAENHQNRSNYNKRRISIYRGVHVLKDGRITATICCNYNHFHLGTFKTEIEAAQAYDNAAKKYFKEYANLNFK